MKEKKEVKRLKYKVNMKVNKIAVMKQDIEAMDKQLKQMQSMAILQLYKPFKKN